MNKRELGAQKEEEICACLLSEGIEILERNFRCRQGEIDIVGRDGGYMVFFEVKYRRNAGMGSAAEAVGYAKQRRICRVADYYRMLHGCAETTPIRFDVVAMDGPDVRWIRNAFPYIGR